MLEFVDFGLYFVQDENNFINPLLQVGSGSDEKRTGSGGPKMNGYDRILIPAQGRYLLKLCINWVIYIMMNNVFGWEFLEVVI